MMDIIVDIAEAKQTNNMVITHLEAKTILHIIITEAALEIKNLLNNQSLSTKEDMITILIIIEVLTTRKNKIMIFIIIIKISINIIKFTIMNPKKNIKLYKKTMIIIIKMTMIKKQIEGVLKIIIMEKSTIIALGTKMVIITRTMDFLTARENSSMMGKNIAIKIINSKMNIKILPKKKKLKNNLMMFYPNHNFLIVK